MAGNIIRTRVVKNGLTKLRKERPEEVRAIHARAAQVIASVQTQLCPEDTGALKGTIRIEQDGQSRIAVKEGTDEINYAAYVERGTEGQVAQPHIKPAAIEGMKYRDAEIAKLARKVG